jgi:hypothetical protein
MHAAVQDACNNKTCAFVSGCSHVLLHVRSGGAEYRQMRRNHAPHELFGEL